MKYLPWGLALVFLVGFGHQQRERGRAEAVTKVWKESALYWKKTSIHLDSTYRDETSKLANEMLRYKNRRVTLPITDTVAVKAFIATADSTIETCKMVVSSCEVRVAARDSLIANQNRQIQVLIKHGQTSVWSKIPWVAAGVLGGVLLSK